VSALYPFAALLASIFVMICGNALIGVVVPIRANLDGFGALTVGLLGSAYFLGMLVGTLKTPAIVRQVGHIRAFAAFVAIAAVSVEGLPLSETPAMWLISRASIGFVFAGIYAVIESWINGKAHNRNRGSLYAVYQIVNFAASAAGQLALRGLDPRGFTPFVVGAALLTLGIVPLSMTRSDAPDLPLAVHLRMSWLARLSPISVAASFVAGATNGAAISLAPVYALQIGVEPSAVPLFTASIVLGSALGVFPIGRLSDKWDRRVIMLVVMVVGAGIEFGLAGASPRGLWLSIAGFSVGATTYTIYTLAVSIANDRAVSHDMVLISAGLLFVYCVAAIVTPPLASLGMRWMGPSLLFAQNGAIHAALAAFAAWTLLAERRPAAIPL
jgi:MFS family permease